jgi:hypothetical protein
VVRSDWGYREKMVLRTTGWEPLPADTVTASFSCPPEASDVKGCVVPDGSAVEEARSVQPAGTTPVRGTGTIASGFAVV